MAVSCTVRGDTDINKQTTKREVLIYHPPSLQLRVQLIVPVLFFSVSVLSPSTSCWTTFRWNQLGGSTSGNTREGTNEPRHPTPPRSDNERRKATSSEAIISIYLEPHMHADHSGGTRRKESRLGAKSLSKARDYTVHVWKAKSELMLPL